MSRELDAMVAEKVMGLSRRSIRVAGTSDVVDCWVRGDTIKDGGWSAHELRAYFGPSPYSTDPAADYSVLVHVRETWDETATGKFVDALVALWHFPTPLMYRPGDYAKAALTALGVEHTEGSPR